MRSYLILLGILLLPQALSAQFFESGQDPAAIQWNQINTDNFQIIFPCSFEKEAQRLANTLELVYTYAGQSLDHKPKKISVVLHNHSAIGNAFVAWAPKRMELYTIPPQDIYPQDWLDQLAIHEFRHVVQLSKMNQGITRILYFILGEQAAAGISGLFVPLWFTEGDAVAAETGLSATGRGRLPQFEMPLRTQLLGRKIYSYEKAVFGSYKDFVPDRYHLGYYLVSNARKRYGAEIWDSTLDQVARRPYTLTPFSRGIRKASGMNKWKFYRSAMEELDSLWTIQQSELRITPFERVPVRSRKVYTNYRFPQWLNDTTLIAEKSGMADIEQFVMFNGNGERKIFTPGYYPQVRLSARERLVVWAEFGFDKRWENRRFNDVIAYDLVTHKKKRLTRRRYLFAPALSPDGLRIAAVEITPQNNYALVILDAGSGKEIKKISHPDSAFLITPSWDENGNSVWTVVMTKEGKSIARVDPDSGSFEYVLPFSFKDIALPVQSGRYVFYQGSYSGIPNIYAADIESRQVYQVTSSRYGAFDPAVSPDGRSMAYSEYTPMGFDIARISLSPSAWDSLGAIKDNSVRLYEVLAGQEGGALDFDTLQKVSYPVKRYRKFTNLLNFHSWSPFYTDPADLGSLAPRLTLFSQNKLSTAVLVLSYDYNYHERVGSFTTDVRYKAWYPVFNFTSRFGGRASYAVDSTGRKEYTWQESAFALGISQPLNLTKGKYSSSVIPSISVGTRYISRAENAPTDFFTGRAFNLQYNFQAYRLLKTSLRDMRSRWGQALLLNYKHSPAGTWKARSLLSAQLALYFPGIGKHHSLRITVAWQRQGRGLYNFASPVSYVRGYYRSFIHEAFRKLSADYKLPLLYPDLRLGPFLYLTRIKGNLFYDYGLGLNKGRDFLFQSVGVELTSDLHLLNFLAPFDVGFRYVYLPSRSSSRIEALFGINLNNI